MKPDCGDNGLAVAITRTLRGRRLLFEIRLQSEQAGRWYIILLSGAALMGDPLVTLAIDASLPEGMSARRFVPLRFAGKTLAQYYLVAAEAGEQAMAIEVHREHGGEALEARFIAIPKFLAALMLICLQPSVLLPRKSGPMARVRAGFRKRLAFSAIKLGPRLSYAAWQRWYDRWNVTGKMREATVMAVVFSRGAQDRAALEATLGSIEKATGGGVLPITIVDRSVANHGAALRAALVEGVTEFVIVLQAGETVAPHAIAALVRFAEQRKLQIVYADEDRVDLTGMRSDPLFKPEPNRMMMLSGALATGVFLIRREAVNTPSAGAAEYADALRLETWLSLRARPGAVGQGEFSARLPLILTHRRPDTATPPAELLAAIVRAHLGPAWTGEIEPARLPLRIRPGIAGPVPKVSLIIASTARLPHVRSCLMAILQQTEYPDFEMVIVLSQSHAPDAVQQEILAPILRDARVRVVLAPMERFNYSRANNIAAAQCAAPLICLLNDDVAPIATDWLSTMVGHLQDDHIAAVGAKLYYPEETVQHGGVIIGLCGLCDHSFRFLPRAEPGYGGRAVIEQELSAVTAACMLIRKPVFDAVGGLDEHFASAYNDVDLCLKIRAAGYGIVWSAQAELWHHETISFGQHYADEHKQLADRDIGIMRERWASCLADPFHNPNLSLEVESEWELAFPPRLGGLPESLGLVAADD